MGMETGIETGVRMRIGMGMGMGMGMEDRDGKGGSVLQRVFPSM